MTAAKRHPAGIANYPGDTSHMVGEVKGPTTYGATVVAETATYYRGHDVTVVSFGYATLDDVRQPYAFLPAGVDLFAGARP